MIDSLVQWLTLGRAPCVNFTLSQGCFSFRGYSLNIYTVVAFFPKQYATLTEGNSFEMQKNNKWSYVTFFFFYLCKKKMTQLVSFFLIYDLKTPMGL